MPRPPDQNNLGQVKTNNANDYMDHFAGQHAQPAYDEDMEIVHETPNWTSGRGCKEHDPGLILF
jgi:hypothetical protein